MPLVLMQREWRDDPKCKDVPPPDAAYVAHILQENDVAFVARERNRIVPFNELGSALSPFH